MIRKVTKHQKAFTPKMQEALNAAGRTIAYKPQMIKPIPTGLDGLPQRMVTVGNRFGKISMIKGRLEKMPLYKIKYDELSIQSL